MTPEDRDALARALMTVDGVRKPDNPHPPEAHYDIPEPYQTMSEADRKLYEDAAYKTPWWPYVSGQLSMSMTPNRSFLMVAPPTVNENPDPVLKYGYGEAFRQSLKSPVLATADPRRVSYEKDKSSRSWIGSRINDGMYDRKNGYGYANDTPDASRGNTLAHELFHGAVSDIRKSIPNEKFGLDVDHYIMPYEDAIRGTTLAGSPHDALLQPERNGYWDNQLDTLTRHAMDVLKKRPGWGG